MDPKTEMKNTSACSCLPTPPVQIEDRLLTWAKSIIWCGGLLGGSLLFLHFFKVRYLPSFDLTSLMGTIAGVAGLGLLLVISSASLLALPGLALLAADQAGIITRFPARTDEINETNANKTLRKSLLKAWLTGSLIATLILVFSLLDCAPNWLLAAPFFLTPIFWLVLWLASLLRHTPLALSPGRSTIFFFMTFWLFGAYCFSLLYIMGSNSTSPTSSSEEYASAATIYILIFLSQGVIYSTKGQPYLMRIIVLSAITLFLTISSSISSAYTENIGRFFGFGSMQNMQLVLTNRGCEILNIANSSIGCDTRGSDTTYITGRVDIWTRIGRDTLISAPGDLGFEKCPRFLIPNSEILSVIITHADSRPTSATINGRPRSDAKTCPSLAKRS